MREIASEIPVPEGRSFFEYQKSGIEFALERANTLFSDEMGLGKSVQAIGVINASPTIRRVLVICPASLKLMWGRELHQWLTRPMTVEIVNGKGWAEGDITIINYDLLDKHQEALKAKKFDLKVIDEAHYCKNPKAQRTPLALTISAKRSLLLTGTPILNRPIELYPLLTVLDSNRWGTLDFSKKWIFTSKEFWSFAKRYCNAKRSSGGWDFSGNANLLELQTILRATCMVRRLKKDVLPQLPPKTRGIIEIFGDQAARKAVAHESSELERHQGKWSAARSRVAALREGDNREAYEAAVQSLRDVARVAFRDISRIRHEMAVSKIPSVIEFVKLQLEDNDNKIVLFSYHRDVANGLIHGLTDFNPVQLMGGMSMDEKQQSVDAFQNDANCRIFVGNIKAAGVGLTLTASSHVIFAELDWVPAIMSQAEDRLHRIGQRDNVLVQHLVLEGSLDARMAQRCIEKQRIADEALDVEPEHVFEQISYLEQVFEQCEAF
jgi:SWI/SNF-related matrix-associated actin-dependent regulator 1 of chromatin subfamily A